MADYFDARWTPDGIEDGWERHGLTCSLPPSWDRWNAPARWDWFLLALETLLEAVELYAGAHRSTPMELVARTAPSPLRTGPPLLHLALWWRLEDVVPWALTFNEIVLASGGRPTCDPARDRLDCPDHYDGSPCPLARPVAP